MKRYFVGQFSHEDVYLPLTAAGKLTERGVGATYLSKPTVSPQYAVGFEFDDSDVETVAIIKAAGKTAGDFHVSPVQ